MRDPIWAATRFRPPPPSFEEAEEIRPPHGEWGASVDVRRKRREQDNEHPRRPVRWQPPHAPPIVLRRPFPSQVVVPHREVVRPKPYRWTAPPVGLEIQLSRRGLSVVKSRAVERRRLLIRISPAVSLPVSTPPVPRGMQVAKGRKEPQQKTITWRPPISGLEHKLSRWIQVSGVGERVKPARPFSWQPPHVAAPTPDLAASRGFLVVRPRPEHRRSVLPPQRPKLTSMPALPRVIRVSRGRPEGRIYGPQRTGRSPLKAEDPRSAPGVAFRVTRPGREVRRPGQKYLRLPIVVPPPQLDPPPQMRTITRGWRRPAEIHKGFFYEPPLFGYRGLSTVTLRRFLETEVADTKVRVVVRRQRGSTTLVIIGPGSGLQVGGP